MRKTKIWKHLIIWGQKLSWVLQKKYKSTSQTYKRDENEILFVKVRSCFWGKKKKKKEKTYKAQNILLSWIMLHSQLSVTSHHQWGSLTIVILSGCLLILKEYIMKYKLHYQRNLKEHITVFMSHSLPFFSLTK